MMFHVTNFRIPLSSMAHFPIFPQISQVSRIWTSQMMSICFDTHNLDPHSDTYAINEESILGKAI